ncbi:MAG: DinB family protein [Planctomycetota bacterium JB042]
MSASEDPVAPLSIEPPSGMGREVGLLFAALEECRRRTRDTVAGMSTADLDHRFDDDPHSIGAHLLHVAGVELEAVQRVVLGERVAESEERELAAGVLDSESSRALSGHDVGYYLGKLDEVRARTESACWSLKDDDLERESARPGAGRSVTLRWMLAHLADHEAHHRGEIASLRRRLARRRG